MQRRAERHGQREPARNDSSSRSRPGQQRRQGVLSHRLVAIRRTSAADPPSRAAEPGHCGKRERGASWPLPPGGCGKAGGPLGGPREGLYSSGYGRRPPRLARRDWRRKLVLPSWSTPFPTRGRRVPPESLPFSASLLCSLLLALSLLSALFASL